MPLSTISVYPQRETTYPDAAGVPIPSAGATVAVSEYILLALARQYLLTEDPYDIYNPEDRTDAGGGSGDGAPTSAPFVVTETSAGLSNESVLQGAGGTTVTPGSGVVTVSSPARSSSTPQPLGAAAAGSTGQVSDAGHVHAHGNQTGGALHAAATTDAAGFMTATHVSTLESVAAAVAALQAAPVVTYSATGAFTAERVLSNGTNSTIDTGTVGQVQVDTAGGGGGGTGYPPHWIVVTEAPYNAVGDGVADDTAAIQAALDACVTGESVVFLPPGEYRITGTLYSGPDTTGANGVHILGANANEGQYVPATLIRWDGAADDMPALWISGMDTRVENLGIQPTGGRDLYAGIVWAKQPGASDFFNSNCVFRGLTITCENIEDRTLQYGIMVGGSTALDTFTPSNFENSKIDRCIINNARQAGVVYFGGQPINSHIANCAFTGYANASFPQQVGGAGVSILSGSFTGRITDTDFQSLETWVQVSNVTTLAIVGGESEHCKTAIITGGPFAQAPGSIEVSNVRCICDRADLQSLGPSAYAPSSDTFFSINNGCALTLRNNLFLAGSPSQIPMQFKVQVGSGVPLLSEGNIYPNSNPFRVNADFTGVCRYGVRSSADAYQSDNTDNNAVTPLPERFGGVNPSQVVTISGSETSAYVPLTASEIDLGYFVDARVESASWGATVSVPFVTDRGMFGFTVNLPTAPGSGQFVNIRCTPRRDSVAALSGDVVQQLGAVAQYTAPSTLQSGGNTSEWLPVIPQIFGGGFSIGSTGSAQAERTADANLSNRLSVPFAGNGGYIQNLAFVPSGAQTWVIAGYFTSGTIFEHSNSSPGNGLRLEQNGANLRCSRLAVNTDVPTTFPLAAVIVIAATQSSCSVYVSALTPTTTATASGDFDENHTTIGSRRDGSNYLTGSVAELAMWNRVLDNTEIQQLLTDRCAYYGITLGA